MTPFSDIDWRTFDVKNLVCWVLVLVGACQSGTVWAGLCFAPPIEQSTPGFANSRVRALPHVHPRGLGSRPSSLRGLNEEFYLKKFKTKKLRHLED
jgi:hypothetical protein